MDIKEEHISVVNHAYNIDINCETRKKKENKFIYAGRLVPEKGIGELLDLFSARPDCQFIIIGDGILRYYGGKLRP